MKHRLVAEATRWTPIVFSSSRKEDGQLAVTLATLAAAFYEDMRLREELPM